MKQQVPVDRAGFYVAGGHFFDGFRKKNPEIEEGCFLLKEWEIFQKAKEQDKPDLHRLAEYEKKYGDPSLWSAVVADRRLFLGKKAAITQDYRCRHSHEQIQSILQVTIEEMEKLFDGVKPDLVVGFICVTTGEYIASMIAKDRKIPLINLRAARIDNYFYEGETVHEPPTGLEEEYKCILQDPTNRDRASWLKARNIIDNIHHSHLKMYEGAPAASWSQTGRIVRKSEKLSSADRFFNLPRKRLSDYFKYRWGRLREDPQYLGLLFPLWYHRITKPLRTHVIRKWFKKNAHCVTEHDLSSLDYVYFPLHKEPELSLLVFGSFCLNQIEVIRQIARSLPVGMKLVVKDHPAGPGYHPLSYYKKIAAIPNVVLVPSTVSNRTAIRFSHLVTIISGSTGLEAVMIGRPVIVLAQAPFQFLPKSMVRNVRDLSSLPTEIRDLLASYAYNEEALLAYVSAIIENSVAIDFYSLILERPEHPREESEKVQEELRQKHLEELASYLLRRYQKRNSFKNAEKAMQALLERPMNQSIKHLLLPPDTSIRKAMITITEAPRFGAPVGLVLIVDGSGKLLGVVTDGDIRRALVRDVDIDSPVGGIMVRDPITVPRGLSEMEMLEKVSEKAVATRRLDDVKVNQVIVADEQGRVDDVVDFLDLWKSLNMRQRTVCVVGLGFVGLTLSVTLADIGWKVYGYDIKESLIKSINQGMTPFYEKGVAPLLKFHALRKNIQGVSTVSKGLADVYIITTGTPIDSQCKPDLTDLRTATEQVSRCLKKRDLVLLRSTVPVETTRQTVLPLLEAGSGLKGGEDFYLAFAPERTIEGNALEELRMIPQIIGGINKRSLDAAVNFFSHINKTIVRVQSLEAAEMVKLANNSFRDLSFAFSNEFTLVCDKLGLDAVSILEAANEGYPRNRIPLPSPGVGGTCLHKDPHLYATSARTQNMEALLPSLSRQINDSMIRHVCSKLERFVQDHKKGIDELKIFLIGFAFKGEPEISDMRDSSTLELLALLKQKKNWRIFGYDPIVPKGEIEKLEIVGVSLVEGFRNADCAVIMNNHRSYRDMDVLGLSATMRKKGYLLDGWHLFPKEEIERVEGVVYGGLSGGS